MKQRSWTILLVNACLLFLPAVAYCQSDFDTYKRAMCGTMILDEDWRAVRYGMKAVKTMFPDDELLNDLVAERLSEIKVAGKTASAELNAARALIETLVVYKSDRYQLFLKKIRQENAFKPEVNVLIDNLKTTAMATSQFVPGVIDAVVAKSNFAKTMEAYKKKDRSGFAFVVQVKTLDELLEKIGAPDLVSAWKVHAPKLELHYVDLGLVVLNLDTSNPSAPQWKVLMTANELTRVSKIYRGEHFDIAQNLASIQGRRLKMYTKSNRSLFRDVSLLSVLVYRMADAGKYGDAYEKVVTEKAMSILSRSNDPISVDTLRYAAESRNARLADAAGKSLLHRQALEAAHKLNDTATEKNEDKEKDNDMDDKDDDDEEDPEK